MTTFDKLVSSDLAALGTQSRHQLPALDETLRAVSARVRRRDRAHAASDAPDGRLALFALEAIYAQRVARAAAGAMGILCTAVLLLALYAPGLRASHMWLVWVSMLDRGGPAIAATIAALMIVAYAAGGSVARRRFVRTLERTAVDDARTVDEIAVHLVRSVDGRSVAFAVGGAASVAVLVVVMTWLVGWHNRQIVYYQSRDSRAPFLDPLHTVTAVIVCIVLAALALGWACTRPRASGWIRALERPVVARVGAVVAAAAVLVVRELGVTTLPWSNDHNIPSSALRTPVMMAAAIAAFLILAGAALRLRRREHCLLEARAPSKHAPLAVTPALLSLADVLRQRIARMAGGGVALVYALTLLIVIHGPFGESMEWLLSSRMSGPVLAVMLVFAARLLAGRLAVRVFVRRLDDLPVDDLARSAIALGRRLVQRLDAASAALGIAGVASLAALFAVLGMTVGDSMQVFLQVTGPRSGSAVSAVLRDCELATGL
jgi:hypothetical protein